MNSFEIWMLIGWAIPIAIIAWVAYICFSLYKDAKYQSSRLVSAPELPGAKNKASVFKENDKEKKTKEAPKTISRKESRSNRNKIIESSNENNGIWANTDDSFDLTSGKD